MSMSLKPSVCHAKNKYSTSLAALFAQVILLVKKHLKASWKGNWTWNETAKQNRRRHL